MIRSFAVACLTIAVVVLFSPWESLLAQSGKPVPTNVPVEFSGGTPGLNLELYINNGKVADATVNPQGTASSFLDFSNLGKVEVHIYVDECQDGKTVKVMVAAGQTAEDNGCKRRFVGAPWTTTCGVTRITINLHDFRAHTVGCGGFFTEPKGIGTLAGIAGGGLLVALAGGGSDTTVTASTPTPTPTATTSTTTTTTTTTTTPTTPVAPPPTTTIPVTPPVNQTTDFSVTGGAGSWEHTNPGVSSTLCGRFATTPVMANAPFLATISGPGASQPNVSGTTNAAGIGLFRSTIVAFGGYSVTINVTAAGLSRTGTISITVTSANGTCPSS